MQESTDGVGRVLDEAMEDLCLERASELLEDSRPRLTETLDRLMRSRFLWIRTMAMVVLSPGVASAAGMMGGGIAIRLVKREHPVYMKYAPRHLAEDGLLCGHPFEGLAVSSAGAQAFCVKCFVEGSEHQ